MGADFFVLLHPIARLSRFLIGILLGHSTNFSDLEAPFVWLGNQRRVVTEVLPGGVVFPKLEFTIERLNSIAFGLPHLQHLVDKLLFDLAKLKRSPAEAGGHSRSKRFPEQEVDRADSAAARPEQPARELVLAHLEQRPAGWRWAERMRKVPSRWPGEANKDCREIGTSKWLSVG